MYLIPLAWLYVVLMMAIAEATSTQGSVLGALITFVFYGLLPIAIVVYVMGTPLRRRERARQEALDMQMRTQNEDGSGAPDAGGHAPGTVDVAPSGGGITPVRKED